jgi:hypothetical protein
MIHEKYPALPYLMISGRPARGCVLKDDIQDAIKGFSAY